MVFGRRLSNPVNYDSQCNQATDLAVRGVADSSAEEIGRQEVNNEQVHN